MRTKKEEDFIDAAEKAVSNYLSSIKTINQEETANALTALINLSLQELEKHTDPESYLSYLGIND